MKTVYKKALLVVIPITFLAMMSGSLIEFRVQAQTPAFEKSNFNDPLKIDNKYYSLKPGTIMGYNGTDEEGKSMRDKRLQMIGMRKMTKEMYGTWERIRLTLPTRKTPMKVPGNPE